MGKKVFWKSVTRRWGSLLLLLAVIATASFGFVLRTVEYLTVSGELERISGNYRPVGTLSSDSGDIAEGIARVEESPYLDFADIRRSCPAILADLYNADLDGYTSDRTGSFGNDVRVNDILAWVRVENVLIKSGDNGFRYSVRVEELVLGYPDYAAEDKKLMISVPAEAAGEEPLLEAGSTYLIRGYYNPDKNMGSPNTLSFDLLPLEEGLYFLQGEADESVAARYIDADALLQERNRHAVCAVTTADMSAMPLAQESAKDFYLEDGRWPNREDNENKTPVCAVSKEFADVRGLRVGDTLRLTLQNRAATYYGYTTDADEDTWETDEKTDLELEIVGIYGRLYGGAINNPGFANLSSRSNMIYIPDGCMPESYAKEQQTDEGSFSFVLTSPKVKDAFVQETADELKALGITCTFVENNWESYYASAKGIEQGARYNFAVFATVLVFALAAVAFLYTWQRKREVAIARALGVPASAAAFAACFPMILLGAAAVLAGGISAWHYGITQAQRTLEELASGGRADLNVLWLAGICLLLWLALSAALLAGSHVYARKPVLQILQGNPAGENGRRNEDEEPAGVYSGDAPEGAFSLPEGMESAASLRRCGQGRASVFPAMARFLWRHIRRFSMRSVCALLAAAVFVTASGWLSLSIKSSERKLDQLYASTTVEAEIVKKNESMTVSGSGGAYIHRSTVEQLMDTGFVEDVYLEAAAEFDLGKGLGPVSLRKKPVLGVADMEQLLAKDWNSGVQIQYFEGYGSEMFGQECTQSEDGALEGAVFVVVPESVWETLKLKPGDWLSIAVSSGNRMITGCRVAGYYTGQFGGMEDVILMPLALMEFLEEDSLNYLTAQFTLDSAKNRELADFRGEAEGIVEASGAGELALSFVLWDNELKQVVEPMEKNIRLMKLLYPIANLVSFIIAGGLAVLLLFQRRREAAILRVLGVGVVPVRLTLAVELAVLNFVGIALGLCLIYAVTGDASLPAMGIAAGAYFAGGLIGAAAGTGLVTNAKPLALLQARE